MTVELCNISVYISGPSSVCPSDYFYLVGDTADLWTKDEETGTISVIVQEPTRASVYVSQGAKGTLYAKKNGVVIASMAIDGNCRGKLPSYIIVYPNPVSDILTVEIDGDAAARELQALVNAKSLAGAPTFDIRLYDGQGTLLLQQKTKGGRVQFDVSDLRVGVYYLHITDGVSEKPAMQQVIVER